MPTLPSRPSLEHLKKQAKQRLDALRAADPANRLHDAQLIVAREYGFPSWPKLKHAVEDAPPPLPGGEPTVILAHEGHVNALQFSPDGAFLLSAGMDGELKLWSVPSWDLAGVVGGHGRSVNSLSFSPDGALLATGSTDGVARVWRYPGFVPIAERPRVGHSVRVSPTGRRALAIAPDGKARLLTFPDLAPVATLDGHPRKAHAAAFSPDGATLVTAGLGPELFVWDGESGEPLGRVPAHEIVLSVRFEPLGRRLITTGHERVLKLWSLDDWSELAAEPIGAAGGYALSLSPDRRTLALCVEHGVQLRSAESGAPLATLAAPPKGMYGVDFSPDGRYLAACAADKRLRVWTAA